MKKNASDVAIGVIYRRHSLLANQRAIATLSTLSGNTSTCTLPLALGTLGRQHQEVSRASGSCRDAKSYIYICTCMTTTRMAPIDPMQRIVRHTDRQHSGSNDGPPDLTSLASNGAQQRYMSNTNTVTRWREHHHNYLARTPPLPPVRCKNTTTTYTTTTTWQGHHPSLPLPYHHFLAKTPPSSRPPPTEIISGSLIPP